LRDGYAARARRPDAFVFTCMRPHTFRTLATLRAKASTSGQVGIPVRPLVHGRRNSRHYHWVLVCSF
jgi:hypothetical protein